MLSEDILFQVAYHLQALSHDLGFRLAELGSGLRLENLRAGGAQLGKTAPGKVPWCQTIQDSAPHILATERLGQCRRKNHLTEEVSVAKRRRQHKDFLLADQRLRRTQKYTEEVCQKHQ